MTYTDIIELVDRRMPNEYTDMEKLHWLYELDMAIWRDVIQTHLNPDGFTQPQQNGFSNVPLAPEQFTEDLYAAYLQAQIAWHNEEDARYDRYVTRFNDGYERFCKWYNEHYKPIPAGEYWRF